MARILIGVDDTDNDSSPGTGQLARRLAAELEQQGGIALGTTRHQFLVDPRIRYTGHNRGICIAMDWPGGMEELDFVFERVAEWSASGSDPGVCLARADDVGDDVSAWGKRAMEEVLTMGQALALARESDLSLRALGGTGEGIIGAMASVGLRADGNYGRFVDMPGLRQLGECVSGEQLKAMGIQVMHKGEATAGKPANGKSVYKTLGWVRPQLSNGRAILSVEWSDDEHAWVPVDRKKIHPLE